MKTGMLVFLVMLIVWAFELTGLPHDWFFRSSIYAVAGGTVFAIIFTLIAVLSQPEGVGGVPGEGEVPDRAGYLLSVCCGAGVGFKEGRYRMNADRAEESRRLLESVKEKYNGRDELGIRIDELKIGIKETEQAFVRNYPEDSRLLDIGCATGRLCFALAGQGFNVTGIDVASKQIDQAKRFAQDENVNVSYLQYEMPTLPFPDASFAAAFMGNVYCYVPHRASRIAFLEEIARVLYPDGEVFLSQTVLDSVLEGYEEIYDDNHRKFAPHYETLEEGDGFVLGAPQYLHFFFAEDLKAELEVSPFRIVNSVLKKGEFTCVLAKRNT